jgi:uncharacterized protein YukE
MRLPGDPETVRVAARALAMAATEADATRTRTSRADATLTATGSWAGEAAEKFSAAVLSSGTALSAYAAACGKASQTLTIYADDLAAAHAAADRANALAESAGATLDDEGLVVITPAQVPTIGLPRDPATEAAAQNAGREALYDFKNATRRAVAGLQDARHELMPQYQMKPPNLFNLLDLNVGVYTAGVAIQSSPEYRRFMLLSRRSAYYRAKQVGVKKGATLAKFLADRARARAVRFANTAKAAQKLAQLPRADRLATDLSGLVRPSNASRLTPVLKRVPVVGLGISAFATADAIRSGEEPVTEVTATVGSLAVGAVATQVVVGGLVVAGMAGAAPVLIGAAVGAAVAWGVGEGIKWLAHTQAGQDAINEVKEVAGNLAEGVSDGAKAVNENIGKIGGAFGKLFSR